MVALFSRAGFPSAGQTILISKVIFFIIPSCEYIFFLFAAQNEQRNFHGLLGQIINSRLIYRRDGPETSRGTFRGFVVLLGRGRASQYLDGVYLVSFFISA